MVENSFAVNLTLYNDFGHMFDNFSSVHSEWSSNVQDLVFAEDVSLLVSMDLSEQKKHVGRFKVAGYHAVPMLIALFCNHL